MTTRWEQQSKEFEAVAGRPLTSEEFDRWLFVVVDTRQKGTQDWLGAVYAELRDGPLVFSSYKDFRGTILDRLKWIAKRGDRLKQPKERRKIASQGGKTTWKNISKEERSARMRKVILARWYKRKPEVKP